MYTIKCLIISVLIAVAGATEGQLKGTIPDEVEQKPDDLLTSLSAEITKSDVEITLSSSKVPEETSTDSTEGNNSSKSGKVEENDSKLKSGQETSSVSSADETQKITHSSEDNASFIHVKEKMATKSSVEDFAEDEKSKDGNTEDSSEHSKTTVATDNSKNAEEPHELPEKSGERKAVDTKGLEDPESDSKEIEELLKSDADDVEDVDVTTQSRRMLNFNRQLLDALNIPNTGIEPLHGPMSGQNKYNFELIPPGSDISDLVHPGQHIHHDTDDRHGRLPGANPLVFPPPNVPTLPPLTLFHATGKPLHPHFPPPGNIDKHSLPFDKGLPEFLTHRHDHPHFDESRKDHITHHLKALQQFIPHNYEPLQHLPTFQPFQFTTTLPHDSRLQPSQPLPMLQPLQPMQPPQDIPTFESWQPFQAMHSPQSSPLSRSSSSTSTKTVNSFQPLQIKMDNLFSGMHGVHQPPVHTAASNQFTDLFHNNWNGGGSNSLSRNF